MFRELLLGAAAAGSLTAAVGQQPAPAPDANTAAARAVAYLREEVPRWRSEHPCYSCHNNGDATRALIAASSRGFAIGDALDDTLAWLSTPDRWAQNARRGSGSEELPLGRIQFASALASMVDTGRAKPAALAQAAELLVTHQQDDGSWRLSDTQLLGGATFYGTSLATAIASRTLARASGSPAQAARARAAEWLRSADPAAVLDASSILLGLEHAADPAAVSQRLKSLDVLRRGQGPDGGWGPYVTSQSEPFDTALAMLAIAGQGTLSGDQLVMIQKARRYLTATQNDDGSWPETTRPPNGESYAQRISTTAWALLALLSTGG